MDAKKVGLDPKLKEVYDRVMGFTLPTAVQTSPPSITTQPKTAQALSFQTTPASTLHAGPKGVIIQAQKKSDARYNTMLVLTGIIFFIIYTFFWIRVFNLSLPFNLPF